MKEKTTLMPSKHLNGIRYFKKLAIAVSIGIIFSIFLGYVIPKYNTWFMANYVIVH